MALTPIRINPPTKGVNTITPVRELSSDYAIRLDNVWLDRSAAINRRPGQTSITNAYANPFDRIFEYVSQSGAITTFIHDAVAGTILKYNGTGWVTDGAAVYANTPSAKQMGGQLILSDGVTTQYYNGTAWTTPAGIPSGAIDNHCNMFTAHNGRMYGAGSPAFRSAVFFSDALAMGGGTSLGLADWTIATPPTKGGFIDVSGSVGTGEQVMGLASFQGQLVVFLKNSIVMYSIGDPLTANGVVASKVIHGIGCITHESIQGIGNDVMFLSQYGFQRLSEVAVRGDAAAFAASMPINNVIVEALANGSVVPSTIRSAYMESLGVYLCTFGAATWAYHTLFGGWHPWYGIQPQLYYSSNGVAYTGNVSLHKMEQTSAQDTIDGAAPLPINYLWEASPFRSGGQEIKARWNRAEVIYESQGGASFALDSWINLDYNTKQTTISTAAPNNIVANPNNMQWGTATPTADPRTKWGVLNGTFPT